MKSVKMDPSDTDNYYNLHPFAFAAKANANNTPTFHDAMSGPDRDGFIDAMHKEIEQLEDFGAWKVVPRVLATKGHNTILSSTWAFKRKRYPDGRVKKLKARICVRGTSRSRMWSILTHSHL